MSDNIRTALYDAEYTCALANRSSTADAEAVPVVGKHCESGDIVVRDTWLPADVGPGDLLAVAATGAYCRSMASNYNHVPRPPVVGVKDGALTVLVRRETQDDLLRLDAGVAAIADSIMSDALRVALLGCGTVGSQVARLMTRPSRRSCRPHWSSVGARRGRRRRPERHPDVPADLLTTDAARWSNATMSIWSSKSSGDRAGPHVAAHRPALRQERRHREQGAPGRGRRDAARRGRRARSTCTSRPPSQAPFLWCARCGSRSRVIGSRE